MNFHLVLDILMMKDILIKALKSNPNISESELNCIEIYEQNFEKKNIKQNMKKLFLRPKKLKNGEPGKILEIPSIIELHTNFEYIEKWINYSALDAEITFFLRETLVKK